MTQMQLDGSHSNQHISARGDADARAVSCARIQSRSRLPSLITHHSVRMPAGRPKSPFSVGCPVLVGDQSEECPAGFCTCRFSYSTKTESQNTRVVFCLSKFEVTAVNFECCSDLCELLITPKSRAAVSCRRWAPAAAARGDVAQHELWSLSSPTVRHDAATCHEGAHDASGMEPKVVVAAQRSLATWR